MKRTNMYKRAYNRWLMYDGDFSKIDVITLASDLFNVMMTSIYFVNKNTINQNLYIFIYFS